MFKKARLLTRPTLAAISSTLPESVKTASSPKDATYPMQSHLSAVQTQAGSERGDCRPSDRRLSPSNSLTGTGNAGASPLEPLNDATCLREAAQAKAGNAVG